MTWEVDNYNGYPNIKQLNQFFEEIQAIVDMGIQGPPGADGADGTDGTDGWSPVLAIETDLEARYLKVVDWVGGTGIKPAINLYVASTGLSASIDDAIDIRGPAGKDGVDGTDGSDAPNQFVDLIDTPNTLGNEGDVLTISSSSITWQPATGGAETLLDLTDTPNVSGTEGQLLGVGAIGDFEYVNPQTTQDLLPSYIGNAGNVLTVNATEDDVEWVAPSGGGGGGGTFGTWIPTFTNFSGGELVFSKGFYYDLGDMVFINIEVILDATTASQVVINNLPLPIDSAASEYSTALTLSPKLNDPVPGNAVGAWLNRWSGLIYLITATGGVAVSETTQRESFSLSGWYKKATT